MKILAISNHYPPYHAGGYGVLCYRLCEGLSAMGHSVSVLTVQAPNQPQHPGGLRNSLTVVRTLRFTDSCNAVRLMVNTWRNNLQVIKMIRTFTPDLIYVFSIDGVGYQVYHAACTSGVPVVTVVGDTWLAQSWRDLPRFDRWIALANGNGTQGAMCFFKLAMGKIGALSGLFVGSRPVSSTPVHVISTFLLDDLHAAGMPVPETSRLIRCPLGADFIGVNGLPIGRGSYRQGASLRALFVSRMEMLKGPDIAIRAISVARQAGVNVTLTLAGIGSEGMMSELDRLAADLGVADYVRWSQAVDTQALVDLYQAHDVFLFPSRIIEGLGMVCMEAMACGLPVLGTNTGGQTDLIENGETGYVLAPGDYEAMGQRLSELANDRVLWDRLSAGAVRRASLYHGDHVLASVNGALMALVDNRGKDNDWRM